MKKIIVILLCSSIFFLCFAGGVPAGPIANHYTVTVTVTPLGDNSYRYSYSVYNIDQGSGGPPSGGQYGLDGFFIQVPITASISSITDPDSYASGGYWSHGFGQTISPPFPTGVTTSAPLQQGCQWLWFLGNFPASVYPVGSTAHFSFVANVPPGLNQGVAITYLGTNNYTVYEGSMISPVSTSVSTPKGLPWILLLLLD